MRNMYAALIVMASLAFASCDKDVTTSYPFAQGNWELRTRTGGIKGETKTYSNGNGNGYSFVNDTYKKYTDGQLSKSGQYRIVNDSSLLLNQPATRIIFDNNEASIKTLVTFKESKVTLTEDVFDGISYEYEKVMKTF